MGIARHNLTGDTGTHIMLGYIVIAGTILLASAEDVTVMLNKGKLKGERMDYDFGQYYYAFKGIPYAKPPPPRQQRRSSATSTPGTRMLPAGAKKMLDSSLQVNLAMYTGGFWEKMDLSKTLAGSDPVWRQMMTSGYTDCYSIA